MSKNTKKLRKYWQLVTICYQLKGGLHFVLPLYKKKEAYAAYMVKLYSYVISHFENYINYTDMSKSIGLRGLERIHPYAC